MISDDGNASIRTLDHLLKLVEQSSVIIYVVGIFYAVGIFDEDDPDRNPKVLRRLAAATDGVAYFPAAASEASAICASIARDIRN
jgi:hypothetical protein